ncbi:MAG: hypothetical protein GTO45_20375 [Candidatus Aminicenantes bacterium]|nr:hypothetical protein [Candidatus Aminicenantes bacterium]NIM81151.1 hypothetical protein [Candidatus Aminicenantes bacterium]NIN20525.1 hypothetical protein [Candidatus Aminicenantes bacterium]NIN44298.1 hypothetical protein [Candidatus Aminicenantes bacterium]NIN87117.1 hypothetical protein [Candidatus Aminicenantes bacterium]
MSADKKLILKALTDVNFRKLLKENPEEALNLAEIKGGNVAVNEILDTLASIDDQIDSISDKLLCVDPPGSCGIC